MFRSGRALVAAISLSLLTLPLDVGATGKGKPRGGALDVFKSKHGAVTRLVQGRASTARIQKQVDGLLDYDWLAQAALGGPKKGKKRCQPRCAEFEALLTELIRENYLKRIRQSGKGNVEYVGEERRPRATKVTTKVKFTKNGREQELEVAYVMHRVGNEWQVRDIITDGVSLARNYKYEFNKILRESGIDELVRRLENKLAEIAKTK